VVNVVHFFLDGYCVTSSNGDGGVAVVDYYSSVVVLSYHVLEAFSATGTHRKRHIVGGRFPDGGNNDMKLIEMTNTRKQRPEEARC